MLLPLGMMHRVYGKQIFSASMLACTGRYVEVPFWGGVSRLAGEQYRYVYRLIMCTDTSQFQLQLLSLLAIVV